MLYNLFYVQNAIQKWMWLLYAIAIEYMFAPVYAINNKGTK